MADHFVCPLPKAEIEDLKALAEAQNMPVAAVIRQAIAAAVRDYLEKPKG